LAKLGAALDPSADLEFDFLGIQTLYDRYLIIDKTKKPSRRIETPQFFWMRVAMGLFLDEPADRETKSAALYDLYKTRRFCRSTHDMNTANWIPDLFMKRMEARASWTLFRANQVPDLHDLYGKKFEEAYLRYETLAEEGKIYGQKVEALELWKKMLSLIFETG